MSAWLERTMRRAVEAHQQGNLALAASAYEQVLAKAPRNPDALHLLGVVAYQSRDYARAVKCIRDAIASQPRQPLFHFNLGKVLRDAGDKKGAIAAYREALRLAPDYAEALSNLGNALQENGETEAAIECFKTLLVRFPNDVSTWNHLASAYGDICEFEISRETFERALAINPSHVKTLYNYARMAIKAGQLDHAEALLERALALAPGLAEAHMRKAVICQGRQQSRQAEPHIREALRLNPQLEEAWLALGNLLADQGAPAAEIEEAYRKAGSTLGADVRRVLDALRVPVILAEESEVTSVRQALWRRLEALEREGVSLQDPLQEVGSVQLFNLAYHGQDDRKIHEFIADLYRRACPSLDYVAPHCGQPRGDRANRRLRIGFISTFFCEHTIGTLFKALMGGLDRQRFEVFALFGPGLRDGVSRAIAEACEHALEVKPDLKLARRQIAALELDVLFYIDIGMHPFTYFLAFARLAPLQCVAWGHPVTSGVPAVDVYLSSRHQECETGQDHYSERLVCLENPLYVYSRPQRFNPLARKKDFGFADTHLYLCPQSLFKLAPQFDRVMADILRRDPLARIALPEGSLAQWRTTLERRFAREMPDVADRIVFFERMDAGRYLDFTAVADVVLDSMPFGGGLTTLNTLAVGAPIVTMPGRLMSSRFTYTCYRRMGLDACIAGSEAEYVELAVGLASSPARRAQASAEILARNAVLFDNREVVSELERWFIDDRDSGAATAAR